MASLPPPPPGAVQDLLYRRMRSLANYEAANKKLETAKTKNKGVAEVRVCTHCVFRLCVIAYLLDSLVASFIKLGIRSWKVA